MNLIAVLTSLSSFSLNAINTKVFYHQSGSERSPPARVGPLEMRGPVTGIQSKEEDEVILFMGAKDSSFSAL